MTRLSLRRSRRTTVRIRTCASSLLVVLGLSSLAACSNDGPAASPAPSTSTSKPASSASPANAPQATEKAAVLAAYNRYWQEQTKAYAQADITGTDLKKYATKKALTRAMGDVLVMQKAGTATTGSPSHDVTVTTLSLTAKVPTARLQDCLDISKWRTVNKKTGKVQAFPSNQRLRYVATATAEKWGEQWMITDLTPDGSRSC
ncbi:hypothetical protein [Streptomyces sp. NPDC001507]|uniref:hypothetical protein n=1 Tax=Streptomyces sp. NPDC001507 TaxID=3364579 RepID=UPI0036B5EE61